MSLFFRATNSLPVYHGNMLHFALNTSLVFKTKLNGQGKLNRRVIFECVLMLLYQN